MQNDVSIQVIEDCSIVKEYKENIDNLRAIAIPMLSDTGNMSLEEKITLSAVMRRLLETVVNKYVFNNQRHQFKQKNLNVSAFHAFKRLVPLNQGEADKLVDLYGKLSTEGHDDLTNYYRNTS